MSNALAIASVTYVLRDLLNNGLIDHDITSVAGKTVTVTALPPDRIDVMQTDAESRLNLYMYQATPNQGWQNAGLPSYNAGGERLSNPPLALNLHYLLTAYGPDEIYSQILLGYGMQLLHEIPVLTRDAIRRSLTSPDVKVAGSGLPDNLSSLATSELAEQVEQIKINPQTMSAEEISKLWTAFQAKYRPTTAYLASVVLIESKKTLKSALPVSKRNIRVVPFSHPVITSISPQIVRSHEKLTIRGQNLKGATTKVRCGTILIDLDAMSDSELRVTLPGSLRAGVNTIQIVHEVNFDTAADPHHGFESNVVPYVLRPTIIAPVTADKQSDDTIQLSVRVDPVVEKMQRITLLLNELSITIPSVYTFEIPPRDVDTNQLKIVFDGVKTGKYLVRLRVDGAESLPVLDTDPKSPTFNQFTGEPSVAIKCFKYCLQSTKIIVTGSPISPGESYTVSAEVTIQDENNSPVTGAKVFVMWRLPDGNTTTDSRMSDATGIAKFDVSSVQGSYTISVMNIEKKDYTFDALKSGVLEKTENIS